MGPDDDAARGQASPSPLTDAATPRRGQRPRTASPKALAVQPPRQLPPAGLTVRQAECAKKFGIAAMRYGLGLLARLPTARGRAVVPTPASAALPLLALRHQMPSPFAAATVAALGEEDPRTSSVGHFIGEVTVVPPGPLFWARCPWPRCVKAGCEGLMSKTKGAADPHLYLTVEGGGLAFGLVLICDSPACKAQLSSYADEARLVRRRWRPGPPAAWAARGGPLRCAS